MGCPGWSHTRSRSAWEGTQDNGDTEGPQAGLRTGILPADGSSAPRDTGDTGTRGQRHLPLHSGSREAGSPSVTSVTSLPLPGPGPGPFPSLVAPVPAVLTVGVAAAPAPQERLGWAGLWPLFWVRNQTLPCSAGPRVPMPCSCASCEPMPRRVGSWGCVPLSLCPARPQCPEGHRRCHTVAVGWVSKLELWGLVLSSAQPVRKSQGIPRIT